MHLYWKSKSDFPDADICNLFLVWSKVQKAMKDLGDKITDATKKAIEEYKPKIKDALTKVKKVVIDGARKIIIEVHGGIVKILTDGVTGTSD